MRYKKFSRFPWRRAAQIQHDVDNELALTDRAFGWGFRARPEEAARRRLVRRKLGNKQTGDISNSSGLCTDGFPTHMHSDHVAFSFVEVAQQVIIDIERPAAIGNLVEADVFADERGRDHVTVARGSSRSVGPQLGQSCGG